MILLQQQSTNGFPYRGLPPDAFPSRIHWIPVECYSCLDRARRSSLADVWAFATTLFEIFSYGQPIDLKLNADLRQYYASRRILPRPQHCPAAIYDLMKECWELDQYKRKLPQAITRDINQILYEGSF